MIKQLLLTTAIVTLPAFTNISSAQAPSSQESLRVVSASNPLTQIVAALDREELFVGLDKTSHTKPEYNKIPDVGYRIQLSTEGILSLKPDLVLLAEDSGPAMTIEQLKNSTVEIIQFAELKDVPSIQSAVSIIADKLQREEDGKQLNQKIAQDATDLQTLSEKNSSLNGFFVLQGGNGHGSPQISGSDTTAAKVLELLNINNLFADDYANYRAVTIENQMQKRPDIVLLGHTGQFDLKKGDLKEEEILPFERQTTGMIGWPDALQPKCVFNVNMSNYLVFGIHIYEDNLKLLTAINQCLAEL